MWQNMMPVTRGCAQPCCLRRSGAARYAVSTERGANRLLRRLSQLAE